MSPTVVPPRGSPVEQIFGSLPSAEKAKRRETMRRAGRVLCDMDDLKVTVNLEL